LLANTTITQSVTRTNGSPTLTGFSDTTQIRSGAPVEGAGIPSSTTISSCTSTTCTMSANASSSGTANVTIFPNGNGDGSTTFNLPNCQGAVLAGRDNMSGTPRAVLTSTYFGTNPDSLGAFGGNQSVTMALANLIQHTHTINDPGHSHTYGSAGTNNLSGAGISVSTPGSGSTSSSTTGITINNTGSASPTPMAVVQPTLTANCMIRVLAMIDAPRRPSSSLAANDNGPPIIGDRRRVV
jgi:microcystin-dependent protein